MTKLWEALDILRKGGMVKHVRKDLYDQHCALGLLDEVHGFDVYRDGLPTPEYRADVEALLATARALFPERMVEVETSAAREMSPHQAEVPEISLAMFNNHLDTRQADLELVFEKTAIQRDEVLG